MARIGRGCRAVAALCAAAVLVSMRTAAAATPTSPFDPGEELFLRANLEFTLFHEFGHMAIDELGLPVLGMEEDAADRIAVVAMVLARQERASEDIIPWLFAVAGDWYTEWELGDGRGEGGEIPYWEQHPLEIQRFHNIVCLVFGSDPETLSGLVDTELLPFSRAVSCEREYRLANRAVQWVLATHGPDPARGSGSQIAIRYLPAAPARRGLADWVAASGIAEAAAARLAAAVRLPRPIVIEFEDCAANPDAVWRGDLQLVSICYQLLEHFLEVGRYRIAHRERACGIPEVRNWLGRLLACPPAEG